MRVLKFERSMIPVQMRPDVSTSETAQQVTHK